MRLPLRYLLQMTLAAFTQAIGLCFVVSPARG